MMIAEATSHYTAASIWANGNQGVLSVYLFLAALFLGWVTGFFGSLMRKPKFRMTTIEGPTFVCTFGTGEIHDGYDVHRTGIALYLQIANIGSAPASIIDVEIGYRWAIIPFKRLWWRNGLFRFWLKKQAVSLQDFQVRLGDEYTKVYPFLTQQSHISGKSAETHLDVGRSTSGVVYFEQHDSFGACFPFTRKYQVKLKVRLIDSFGKGHSTILRIPRVTLADARLYNPSFGLTLATLRSEAEPIELPMDTNGNLIAPPQPATTATSNSF